MKAKTIYIVIAVIIVALVGWYFMKNSKPTTSAVSAYDTYVAKAMAWMSKDPAMIKILNEKAAKNKISFAEQLRGDAGWLAENSGLMKP